MRRVIVLCFLQPQPLAQVNRAFPRPHRVTNANTWDAFLSGVREERVDIVVVDPCAGASQPLSDRLCSLASELEFRPTIPIVGYVSVTASAMRAVQGLVALGAAEIVIRGVDDSAEALSATVQRSVAAFSASRVVRAVGLPFETLPSGVALALQQAFHRPAEVRSVADLATAAKMTRRSLDRWLARAGFSSARTLLACARVNAAFHLLAAGSVRMQQAASALGYSSSRSLAREVHAVTGYPASAIPSRLSRDAFDAALGRRLLRSPGDATPGPMY